MHGAQLEGDHAVAHARQQRHVVLDDEQRGAGVVADAHEQRSERLGLALGDAGRRLVEQHQHGVLGQEAGQLDDAPHAGRQLGGELVGVVAEPEQPEQLVDPPRRGELGLVR